LEPNGMDQKVEEDEKFFYQGLAFIDQGKLDKAISVFQRALENDPELASAHNNLGILFKQKGQEEHPRRLKNNPKPKTKRILIISKKGSY